MNNLILQPVYWAAVSGGKDSLYMLKLIWENPELYNEMIEQARKTEQDYF